MEKVQTCGFCKCNNNMKGLFNYVHWMLQTRYALFVKDYEGGLGGDSLAQHDGQLFYTKDKDSASEYARAFGGGWW